MRRLIPLLALVGLLAGSVSSVPAQKKKAAPGPTLVVRVRSIDSLLADAKYLMILGGQKEVAEQLEGVILSMIGPKGLDGIDTKRPFGLYGSVGPNGIDSNGVVLVPIADQKAFLSFLDRLNLNPKELKGQNGLYRFTPPNSQVDAYFRFANDYVYVSAHIDVDQAKNAVETSAVLPPAQIFPAGPIPAAGLSIRIDTIPDGIKQLILQQLELKFAEAKEKDEPGESEAQKKLKQATIDEIARNISLLIKDGGELAFSLDVDRQKDELATEFSLSGVAGSKLAKDIATIGQAESLFASGLGSDSALGLLVRLVLPAEVKQAMAPVIDEGVAQGLKEIKDDMRRARGEKFLEALKPTLKSGDVDTAFTIRGPTANKQYLALLGIKVQDGPRLESALRDYIKGERPEEQARYNWGAEKAGNVAIHSLDIRKELAKHQQLLGSEPLYFAFRQDAILAAYGDGGLAALKQALTAKPAPTTATQFNLALKRFEPILSFTQNEQTGKAIQDAFGSGSGNDVVRLAVDGGKSLKARFSVKGPVITFIAKVAEIQKNAGN